MSYRIIREKNNLMEPQNHKKKTREYLDKVFTELKENNIIKRYKIRNSYLP